MPQQTVTITVQVRKRWAYIAMCLFFMSRVCLFAAECFQDLSEMSLKRAAKVVK